MREAAGVRRTGGSRRICALTLVACSTTAVFDSDVGWAADDRWAVFGSVGLGGISHAEMDFQSGLQPGAEDRDLDVTWGGGAAYDAELVPHFSLGGVVRAYVWSAERYAWESRGDNAGSGFDFAVQPRAHFDVKLVELYLTLPIGLTFANKDDNRTFVLVDTQYGLGVGYNWGLFAGIEYPFTPAAAGFLEVGWLLRTVFQRGEAEADSSLEGDLEYRTGQFTLNLGVSF